MASPHGPSLAATQELFYALSVAPEGVAQGLADRGLTEADLDGVIAGGARMPSRARMDVYAEAYFFRLRDVLKGDYEKLLACVGEVPFHNLAVAYVKDCPPTHPSIRDAGERLPEFLAGHPLGLARPWLAELARLERTRLEAWDGFPDAPVLDEETLRALPPEDFAALPLRLVPAHLTISTQYAIDELWQSIEDREGSEDGETGEGGEEVAAMSAPAVSPRTLLVWRVDSTVYHRVADGLELEALVLAGGGVTFGVLCERIAERVGEEAAPRAAFELLARWIGDALLAADGTTT